MTDRWPPTDHGHRVFHEQADTGQEAEPPRPRQASDPDEFNLPGFDAVPSLEDLDPTVATPAPRPRAPRRQPPSYAGASAAGPAGAAPVVTAAAAYTTPPEPRDPQPTGIDPSPVPGSGPPESVTSPFIRPLPRTMAIANQKGGVGKTTTAVNLGACLAVIGYRVLVVDLDPQGNASTGLGINIRDLNASMYDVILNDVPLEDCVEASAIRNLFVAPAALDLAGAEIELVPAFSRELRLRRALDSVKDDYDFLLIDCPPSLGLLTINGLAAASEVVVPIQCEYYALEGLGQLLRNVQLVQRNLNPTLELSCMILVMYDARTKLADQVVREVRDHFGEKVCASIVPRTVRLSEAPSFGQPIITFDPASRGAIAYRDLAMEVSGGAPRRIG
ncbi:MAG TPA: AAA family ATPase [Acidimicrobiales bacterium]|nr:AAA family ATPase [Acidimicrobiales bacterium]